MSCRLGTEQERRTLWEEANGTPLGDLTLTEQPTCQPGCVEPSHQTAQSPLELLLSRLPAQIGFEGSFEGPWLDMLRDFLSGKSLVAVANRGGLKTFNGSLGAMLRAIEGRRVMYVSYSQNAVDEAATFIHAWVKLPAFKGTINFKGRQAQDFISFKGGGSVEFRCLSRQSARGAHVDVLVIDEADEVHPIHLKTILFAVRGSPQFVYLSTQNRPHGVVAKLKARKDLTQHAWNFIDTTERCPVERHGTEPATLYVDRQGFRTSESPRENFEAHQMYEGCRTCPLAPTCLGRLADPAKRYGFSPIDGVIDTYRQIDNPPQWKSQAECCEPDKSGLVYPEFSDENVRSLQLKPGTPFRWYLGVDFGLSHPGAMVAVLRFVVDGKVHYHVLREYRKPEPFEPTMRAYLEQRWVPALGLPADVAVDPSTLSRAAEMTLGRRTYSLERVDNTHAKGIPFVRSLIASRRLTVEPSCIDLIEELRDYHYTRTDDGTPSSEVHKLDDDLADALRYVASLLQPLHQGSIDEHHASLVAQGTRHQTLLFNAPE